ncbi:hypothetical protein ACFWWM_34745 [Streptomyces sp. NPDC058682]|uniref:hypothetical protein n=1 Tax=Streptomyces sp. NPDC058682 TaxID=3346596 RepID=UPI003669BD92
MPYALFVGLAGLYPIDGKAAVEVDVEFIEGGLPAASPGKERDELIPGPFPDPADRWIPTVPLLLELRQPAPGLRFVDGRIDRLEIPGDLKPYPDAIRNEDCRIR